MGIGPKKRFQQRVKRRASHKTKSDWFELNEAFAAQSLAVVQDLGLDQRGQSYGRRNRSQSPIGRNWCDPFCNDDPCFAS